MARKVVFFVEGHSFGGTEQVVLNLLRSLDRRVWQPVLFHHAEAGIAPLLQGARDLDIKTESVPRLQGWNVARAGLHLLWKLRTERPAIFHTHLTWTLGCRPALIAAALAQMNGVVATLHLFTEVKKMRTILAQRALARAVDRYVAVSHHVARRMRETFRLPASKIEVVHNGIPLALYRRKPNRELRTLLAHGPDVPIVMTVTRLDDRQKGVSYFLKAAALVPKAEFVVVGDGPDREQLEKLAADLGLEDRVSFLRFRQDIPELLGCCDVFVLPSLLEGLGLVILEAMAAGKPVVASGIGGPDEIVIHGETGLLVPPANAAELARAIQLILDDRSLAARLSAAGKALVECEFSSEVMAQRMSVLYEKLLYASGRIPAP